VFVYIKSEPNLYTVGHYDPQGKWVPESDWESRQKAAARVHYLNGGTENFARSAPIPDPEED
jgi:hypothetical protein